MALEPETAKILTLMNEISGGIDLSDLDVATARANMAARPLPPGPDAQVEDRTIPGPGGPLSLRTYAPPGAPASTGALVYYHGGGFVLGGLDSHDALCRALAVGAGCRVLSVDYRLAPEAKFPSASDDALAAARHVHEHASELGVDPARIAVGGDSAGGNLAAVTALRVRDEGGPPLALQLLMYPVTDWRSMDRPSYADNAEGYYLTRRGCVWFRDHYVRSEADHGHPHLSPLAADSLEGLPPALVITAEHDPLRDEGEAYASALEAAGVPTTLTRYDGTIHAFVSLHAFLQVGRRAMAQATDALRAAFA